MLELNASMIAMRGKVEIMFMIRKYYCTMFVHESRKAVYVSARGTRAGILQSKRGDFLDQKSIVEIISLNTSKGNQDCNRQ